MDSSLRIRPMQAGDLGEVIAMIRRYHTGHADCAKRDLGRIGWEETKPNTQFLVACLHDRIVGCMGFQPDPDEDAQDVYWAMYLYVHPEYYRQGIASGIFIENERRIREIGGRKIYVDIGNAADQPEAIAFYGKQGYVQEGELKDYFCEGEDKLIFGKKL